MSEDTLLAQITPSYRTADDLSIRFAQSADHGDVVVLLTSPWPESLFAFRHIWSDLAQHARLVAIDLPGFGQSERRMDLLTPRAMAQFLAKLIDEWELEAPHIVGPDVGTGATLFLAADHPDKLTSAIVGSGGASYPLDVTAGLKDLIEASNLDNVRAADSRAIVAGVLEGVKTGVAADVREDYLKSYEGDRFVESARYVRAYPKELPILGELLPAIATPVQIISGRHDALVPQSNGEYLRERLRNSTLNLFDTGHFTWEDGAADYAALTSAWITGGYRTITGHGRD